VGAYVPMGPLEIHGVPMESYAQFIASPRHFVVSDLPSETLTRECTRILEPL
jgi:hypothetical protein